MIDLSSYVQFDTKHIPEELVTIPQWVAWQPVWREERGKVDKVPLDPRTGLAGSIQDNANWMQFGVAVEYARANGFGIGFVLTDDDPFTGVDVDGCIVDGQLNDTANDILTELQSYAEVSPSGTGLRVIVRGPHPGGRKSRDGVEMYAGGRFLTITGRHVAGTPAAVAENASGLAAVHQRYLAPATKQAAPPPPTPVTIAGDDVERIREALGRMAAWRADDYGEWVRIGHAIKHELGDTGWPLWDEWSRQSAKYDAENARQRWAKLEPTGDVSISTVFACADEDSPQADPVALVVNQLRTRMEMPAQESDQDAPRTRYTNRELQETEFPPLQWTVSGLLPVGYVTLAGRPKQGKSFLSLQLASCVAQGIEFIGYKTQRTSVLYLALEDSGRRLKDRLRAQNFGKTDNMVIETEWPTIFDGGLQRIADEVDEHNFGLVVIDTFSRLAGRADQMDLARMGELVGTIQKYALLQEITILVIDHTRKNNGQYPDPIDDIMGSTGKSAPIDAAFGLYRKQGESETTLKWTGREIAEGEVAMKFDASTLRWERTTDAWGVKTNSVKSEILLALEMDFGGEATLTDIAKAVERDKSNVRKELAELVVLGAVVKLDQVGRETPYQLQRNSVQQEKLL